MNRRKESLFIILSTSLYMIGIAGSRPIVTLYASELGASYFEIGLLVTLFSVLPLVSSIFLGRKIDKIGQWKPLLASVVLGGLSLSFPLLFRGIAGIYGSQIIGGLAQIIFVVAFQSFVGRHSKKKMRDYFVAIFSIGMASGQFAGPLLGGLIAERMSYVNSMAILGLFIFMTFPMLLLLNVKNISQAKRMDREAIKEKAIDLLKIADLRRAIVISAVILLAKDIFTAYFPLLGVDKGFSLTAIGIIISLNSAAGLIIRIVLPALLVKFNESQIIVFTIMSAGLLFSLFPLFENALLCSILSLLLGFSLGIGQPLSISMTINALPVQRVGEGLGVRLTVNKMTQVLGPLLLGGISSVMGMTSVFYFCSAAILTGSVNLLKKNS